MKKIVLTIVLVVFGIILVSFFWKSELVLSILLIAASFIKSRVLPVKKELLWFVVSATFATATESLIMLTGAWEYKQLTIINFPIWLFFLWGYAGVLAISFYEGLTRTD